jgi:hypothetical protein
MSNHLHLVLKTPEPNLARGMQGFLSSYANAWSRRHQFAGHVFQGRYRAELVEDESYLWVLTRYVHLNPVRARLVPNPADWAWSSYPGYQWRRRRLSWVSYDELLASWDGAFGGGDANGAYRRYVTQGLEESVPSPWLEARHGWILGSEAFIDRIRTIVEGNRSRDRRREGRQIEATELPRLCRVVCAFYGIEPSELRRRGSKHPARPVLAHLARQYSQATNAELAVVLGLGRAESVPNLTKRLANWVSKDRKALEELGQLEQELSETTPRRKT